MKAFLSRNVRFELIQSAVGFLSQRHDEDLVVISEYEGPLSVLGFYSSYDGSSRYRRFTGGPDYRGYSPLYIAILEKFSGGLEAYLKSLSTRLEELGLDIKGGYITGSYKGVLGVTRFGDIFLSELFLDDVSLKELYRDFSGVFNISKVVDDYDFSRFRQVGWRYLGMDWLGYKYVKCPVEESYNGGDGFYLRIGLTFHENFVKRGFLEGSFYASPPHAPYSLLAYLRGVHVDELIFYQFKYGWRNIDLYGVRLKDVEDLVDRLYDKALSYTENL